MKRLQDTIEESLLDLNDETIDIGLISDWLEKHSLGKTWKINKELSIDANQLMIGIDGDIPEYIKFNNVNDLTYYSGGAELDEVKLVVPKKNKKLYITDLDAYMIELSGDINTQEVYIRSSAHTLYLPKKINAHKCFDMGRANIHYIDGLKGIKTPILKLPMPYLSHLIQDTIDIDDSVRIYFGSTELDY